jgi:hypothetical protein
MVYGWKAMIRRKKAPRPDETPADLATEILALRRAVDTLNRHPWMKIENSTPRLLVRQILKGLALGFGTVVGASVLVSVALFFLSRIDFIPIIGEWASDVADVIEAEVEGRRGDANGSGAAANADGSIEPEGDAQDDDGTPPAEE